MKRIGGVSGQSHTGLDHRAGVGHHLRGVLRCLGALGGEVLDLGSHDGKAPSGASRAACLYGGVEREDAGLECDVLDRLGDLGDLLGVGADAVHGGGQGGHVGVRLLYAPGDLCRLAAGLSGAL